MPSATNRRLAPRFAMAVKVTFESEHNFYTGLTHDLSGGGIFVATSQVQPVGELIHLLFTLPGATEPIDCITEVRWVRSHAIPGGGGETGMGLRFLRLSPEAKKAVQAFLAKRESIFFDVD